MEPHETATVAHSDDDDADPVGIADSNPESVHPVTTDPTRDERVPPGGEQPGWTGFLAGAVAAGAALGFGELIEGATDDIPSLVVAVGELIVDYTPGDAVARSIETLGSNQKSVLLTGITVVSLLLGGVIGRLAQRRGRLIGAVGFAAFGVLGGWTAARNPLSPAVGSWVAALAAAAVGAGVLLFLLSRLDRPTRMHTALEDPTDPAATRRAFLAYAGVMGAGAALMVGGGRRLRGKSAAETARESIDIGATRSSSAAGTESEEVTTLDDVLGISSYITPNDDFYRIDTALTVPQVDPATWSLRFTGMVDNPFELTLDDILAMDLDDHVVTLSCVSNEVGGSLVGNATWTGVPLSTLLDRAGIQNGATQVVGRSVDDWTAGFPTDVVFDGRNAILAVGMNGEPLPISHGFPARLVVAGLYGYVSAVKWIEEIHLTRWEDFDGYWVPRGWSKEGPMKTQSRIDVPRRSAEIVAGTTAVAGVAWAPTRGIEMVEISVDDGAWQTCALGEALGEESWVQWKTTWDATPGDHEIQVRATDGDGELQPLGPKAPRPDGAEGYHRIRVRVV
jgi:DMSO/TMAO reductase YedYZ molybdopterin-dependent catalytic subunit